MKLAAVTASLLAAGLLAAPAQADIIEFHAGQSELNNDDLPEVSEKDGMAYRLSAVNFVEPTVYLRLELRQDSLEPVFGSTSITASDSSNVTTPGGSMDATRQLVRFGFGERWGTQALNLGFELGAALIKLEQRYFNHPVSATPDGSGGYIVTTTDLSAEHDDTNGYLGLDLSGRMGGFEWQVDGTGYLKAPQLYDGMLGEEPDTEIWYGANLAWYTDKTTAIGFRYEDAGGFENATIFLRWQM
ncbi:MAG: hypothetical protein R3270_05485 [Gammaproteobacteria bacterium]|nr:hypothetical protein [Gammaproteobacteria bacterium]